MYQNYLIRSTIMSERKCLLNMTKDYCLANAYATINICDGCIKCFLVCDESKPILPTSSNYLIQICTRKPPRLNYNLTLHYCINDGVMWFAGVSFLTTVKQPWLHISLYRTEILLPNPNIHNTIWCADLSLDFINYFLNTCSFQVSKTTYYFLYSTVCTFFA